MVKRHMKKEEIEKDLEEMREIDDLEGAEEEEEKWYSGPIKVILGVFLILLLVLMIVPRYGVKIDPEPSKVLSITEIDVNGLSVSNETYSLYDLSFVDSSDVQIKHIANRVVSSGCESGRVCHAKALYYFVRDNIKYISDPLGVEYVEDPKEVVKSGGGDCESGSILLANLMESVGIRSQLVLISGHAYVRVVLPEAVSGDKIEDDWVYMDWTCDNCDFGEVPWQNLRKQARYMDV